MATLSTIPRAPQADCWRSSRVPAGALVIGGSHGSLGVVRSLGRWGIPVWVLAGSNSLPGYSRYARKSFQWPGPEGARSLEYLLELGATEHLRGWVLFPGGDAEARFIALHHEALSRFYRLTTPSWETLQWAADKSFTYRLAEQIGLDFPRTFRPRGRDEILQTAWRFPLILKPTARLSANAFTNAKAWRVDDTASLLARYERAVSLVGSDSVLLQEWIPGNGVSQFSYAAVCQDGVPIASLTARRRRQYPIDFGFTSTFVQSIDAPAVEELACRFLRAAGLSGLVELEFKYDPRDARYKLLDVNARTWAWVSLGSKAGVDFPMAMWNLALGEQIEPIRGRAGAAWVHVSRDLAAAFAEILAGGLSIPDYVSSLLRASLEFAAFSKDDPLPGILDLPIALLRACRR